MIIQADARAIPLADESVDCCVTSPPYWGLRDYGHDNQLGLERTPAEYVANLVQVFREVRRVLKPQGTVWLVIGDSYATQPGASQGKNGWMYGRSVTSARLKKQKIVAMLKPKDLIGIPWRVAFALQADGWWLRSDIIWAKPNPMPESVTDRPTKAHEYVFLLAKSARYYFDAEAVKERDCGHGSGNGFKRPHRLSYDGRGQDETWELGAGRNIRTVWTITTQPYSGAHFATFPEQLVERCVKAACPERGLVLDPFAGSGTTVKVARRLRRRGVGLEINPEYIDLAEHRVASLKPPSTVQAGLFA